MFSYYSLIRTSSSRDSSKAFILGNILTPRDMEKVNKKCKHNWLFEDKYQNHMLVFYRAYDLHKWEIIWRSMGEWPKAWKVTKYLKDFTVFWCYVEWFTTEDLRNSKMEALTKVSLWITNLKELECTPITLEKYMMASGLMAWSMVVVFGEVQKMIHTLGNGNSGNLMDMECIHG